MTSIDNAGFLGICGNCQCQGLTPAITYSYNATTKAMTVTDGSTFSAADPFLKVNVIASDGQGHTKSGQILVAGGNVVLDLSTGGFKLNSSGIIVHATIVTTARCTTELTAYGIPVGYASGAGVVKQ